MIRKRDQTYARLTTIGLHKRGEKLNKSNTVREKSKGKKIWLAHGIIGGKKSSKLRVMAQMRRMKSMSGLKRNLIAPDDDNSGGQNKAKSDSEVYKDIVAKILHKQGSVFKKTKAHHTLHPGEGHTIPMAAMTSRDVYEKIYPDNYVPKSFFGKTYVDNIYALKKKNR